MKLFTSSHYLSNTISIWKTVQFFFPDIIIGDVCFLLISSKINFRLCLISLFYVFYSCDVCCYFYLPLSAFFGFVCMVSFFLTYYDRCLINSFLVYILSRNTFKIINFPVYIDCSISHSLKIFYFKYFLHSVFIFCSSVVHKCIV